ncbi:MAG TPA: hypothetical protein VIH59_20295 [Candidatus Tectomicrobia bacterium]|jgi:hypothetical protein
MRQPLTGDQRVAALVVYPMNALVNSQLQALENLKEGYERRTGHAFPVTFAKFTGETNDTVREALRQHPPQILLTNYVMAELLLVRPEDQRFLDRTGGGCASWSSTNCTPTAATRERTLLCLSAGLKSAALHPTSCT